MLSGLLQQRGLEGLIHGVAPEPVKGEALMQLLRRHAPGGRAVAVPISLLRRRLGLAAAILSCHRQIVPDRLEGAGAAYSSPDPMAAFERALDEIRISRHGARLAGLANHGQSRPATEPETT
jgi:NAD dependent epimerase/dehydratase family enzyme